MTEQLNNEIWKDIKGYEGLYQVSNLGRVKNLKTNYLLKENTSFGLYKMVALCVRYKKRLFSIHRLVAQAFIPNPLNKKEVNHLDGNKYNNNVSNLEWATRKENAQHAIKMGLQTKEQLAKAVSSMTAKTRKPILQIKDGKVVKEYESARQASRMNNFCISAICHCANGKYKSMYGYEWRYK